MKSERKQVQESNLLADKIEAQFVKIKKSLPTILTIVGVTVVALLGYGFYTSAKETESAKGWTAYYFSDSENLSKVSSDFSGTTAALWARQNSGDQNMAKALENVYLDRDVSDQYFTQAIEDYKAVADKATHAFLKERALYGQAQAAEGLADREQAQLLYRKVAASSSISPEMLAIVNKKVNWLESKAGEEFFSWFKNTRPSAPVPQATPAKLPLPNVPNISFPPVPEGNLPPAVNPASLDERTPNATSPTSEAPATAETPKP
jgi:hypothetical protein